MVTLIPLLLTNSFLWTKYPILLKYMNLWTDLGRKWGLESESKSKIERKPLHHIDIANLENGNTNSHCSLQTLLLWAKYPILLKYMNLWTDSGRKWGLESESKSKIERKHLQHIDISNLVNGNTNPIAPHKLFLMDKVSNFIKIYESLDWFGSKMRSRIRIKIENWKKTSATYRYIQFSEW